MQQKKFFIKDLKELFKKELRVNKISENNKLLDFKEWDSFGNFNVLLACENRFLIKFSEKEFTSLNSFKEISKVVEQKIKKYK